MVLSPFIIIFCFNVQKYVHEGVQNLDDLSQAYMNQNGIVNSLVTVMNGTLSSVISIYSHYYLMGIGMLVDARHEIRSTNKYKDGKSGI